MRAQWAVEGLFVCLMAYPVKSEVDFVWTHNASGSATVQLFDGVSSPQTRSDSTDDPTDLEISFLARRLGTGYRLEAGGSSRVTLESGPALELSVSLYASYDDFSPPAPAATTSANIDSVFEFQMPVVELDMWYRLDDSPDNPPFSISPSVIVENVTQAVQLLAITSQTPLTTTTITGNLSDLIRVHVSMSGGGNAPVDTSYTQDGWGFRMEVSVPPCDEDEVCGDACCNGAENCSTCPLDCSVCGDGCCIGAEACTCAADCARVGACCDPNALSCLDGQDESQCDLPSLFAPCEICADLAPQCGKGACCPPTGACVDNVLPSECQAPSAFTLGTACSELTCTTGACCFPDATCLDGVEPEDCQAPGTHTPRMLCSQLYPPCPQPGCGTCTLYMDFVPPYCLVDIGDVLAVLVAWSEPIECSTFSSWGFPIAAELWDGGCYVTCETDSECISALGVEQCVAGYCCDLEDIGGVLMVLNAYSRVTPSNPICPHFCNPGACELPAPDNCCRDVYSPPDGMSETDCFNLGGTYLGDISLCSSSALPRCP